MAKSGKVVQLFQKPENFIKSRARELQLGTCYITEDWDETGIANIMVSRKHTNGNFTLGIYLVDLKCLGIKDTTFKFNVSEDELDYFADFVGVNEIAYNEVHNIIYGAEAFADSCGFKAHKDWAITQFILEEDDDHIPLIDIEFGEGGVPAYYVGLDDNPAKVKQILATLDKNIGPGNYFFANDDEEFEDDDELFSDGLDETHEGNQNLSFKQIYFTLTGAYKNLVREKSAFIFDENLLDEILNEMVVVNSYSVNDDLEEEITKCVDLHESVFEEKSEESITQIQKLLVKNPDNPHLYTELFLQYKGAMLNHKADAIAKKGFELFPDFLYLRFFVAHAAMVDKELEKGFKLLNNQYYLNQAFPQRTAFSEGEFMFFYSALCHYFVEKGDLDNAIVCSDFLIDDIYTYACNENAIFSVMQAVKEEMKAQL